MLCSPALVDTVRFLGKDDWNKPALEARIEHCDNGDVSTITVNGVDFVTSVRPIADVQLCGGNGIKVLHLWAGTWAHLTNGLQPLRFRVNARCADGSVKAGGDLAIDFAGPTTLQQVRILDCSRGGCDATVHRSGP